MSTVEINANKLMNSGSVVYIPSTDIDKVRESMSYNGIKLSEVVMSDVLPGYLGWPEVTPPPPPPAPKAAAKTAPTGPTAPAPASA